ncbi:hypothetical protein GCM10023350_25830 [Nocardioides endophyticus]|uniref:Polysaccharide biosynthesis protein C-terminal domain-containing protein n=1 Tax=Nocardioides endophyticus TaxID=1353775 RepID=A0ABP8YUQ4_9ACTN
MVRIRLNKTSLSGLVILGSNALPFVLAPARASALDVDGRGALAYFQAALLVIINVSILGARPAAYKHHLSGDSRFSVPYGGLVTSSLCVAFPVGAVCVALGYDYPRSVMIAIVICVAIAPLYTILQFELVDAQLRQLQKRIVMLVGVPSLVDVGVSSILLASGQYSLHAAIAVCIAVEAARIMLAMTFRLVDYIGSHGANFADGLLRDCWKLSVTNVAPTIVLNIDVIILGAVSTPQILGVYAVGKIGFTLALVVSNATEGAAVGALLHRRAAATVRPIVETAALTLLISVAGIIAVLLLFPSDFHEAAHILPMLAIAGLAYGVNRWLLIGLAAVSGRGATILSLANVAIALVCCLAVAQVAPDRVVLYAATYLAVQVLAVACTSAGLRSAWSNIEAKVPETSVV